MNWVLPVKQDAITERTPDFNTGYFLESRNMCMILQRRQHKWKVIPVTGNRGKRVFPSRCNLPRKEAAVNFSCPFGVSQRIKELQDALRYLEKPIIKEDSLQLSKMIEAQFRKAMSDQKWRQEWRQDVKAMEIRYQELLQEGRAEGRDDREMEIVLGMIEEGASDEMILKYLKISKERLEQIKKNQKVHV